MNPGKKLGYGVETLGHGAAGGQKQGKITRVQNRREKQTKEHR